MLGTAGFAQKFTQMSVKNTPKHSKYHKTNANSFCYHFLILFLFEPQFTNVNIIKSTPIKDKVLKIINNELERERLIISQQVFSSKKRESTKAKTDKRIPVQSKIS